MTAQPIHDATTLVLYRQDGPDLSVLMGRRARKAVFMAGKRVFPGGRVEPEDACFAPPLPEPLRLALAKEAGTAPEAIVGAGLRELREETGLSLAATAPLRFVFRAVTPPGRSRRFDARFLMAPASCVTGDPDDFSGADGELCDLCWQPLGGEYGPDIAFITAVVLAEVAAILQDPDTPRPIPFFSKRGEHRIVSAL